MTSSDLPIPALLTEKDAAARLKVSTRTLRSLRAQGHLPFVRIGRQVRYREEDIAKFVERNLVHNRPARPSSSSRIVPMSKRAINREYERIVGRKPRKSN